jgi:HemY protein
MIRVFIYLLVIAALAVGAVWLAERPGEVTVVWQGYRIETSFAVAAIGVVALVFLGMLAWSALRFLLGLPGLFSLANRTRRRAKGFEALSRGMVAVGSGDPVSAHRFAAQAHKLVQDEPLTLLLEAQSAQMSGDRDAAEASFRAMLDRTDTRVLGLRGLFYEARRRGDRAAAQTFADEAVKMSPSLAWANDALLEFHTSTGDWAAARTAVERRAALKLADKAEARRQRAVLLAAEAMQNRDSSPEAALSAALEATKLAPGLVPAAAVAGQLLAERGDARKATKLLEAAWRESAHPDLAAAYIGARKNDSPEARLARAEILARLRPAEPESALALAGAAIGARALDKARAALTPLLATAPTRRACLLMAELEEAEGGAPARVREWLARATRAPHDLAWVADGVVSAHWLPASPVTGALDAFVWTTPPVALGAPGPVLEEIGRASCRERVS